MPQMQSPQVPRSAGGALVIAIDSLGSGLKDSNSMVAHKHATGCDTRKELTVCYPVSNNPDQPVLSREVQLGVADEIIARTREEAAAIEAGNGRGA